MAQTQFWTASASAAGVNETCNISGAVCQRVFGHATHFASLPEAADFSIPGVIFFTAPIYWIARALEKNGRTHDVLQAWSHETQNLLKLWSANRANITLVCAESFLRDPSKGLAHIALLMGHDTEISAPAMPTLAQQVSPMWEAISAQLIQSQPESAELFLNLEASSLPLEPPTWNAEAALESAQKLSRTDALAQDNKLLALELRMVRDELAETTVGTHGMASTPAYQSSEVLGLQQKIRDLEIEIDRIYRSKSMRITRFLRRGRAALAPIK